MARHYDKRIARAREVQATAGQVTRPAEKMTRQEIESFVKGFGLSAAAARRIVDRWTVDQGVAYSTGYDEGQNDEADY